MASPKTVLRGIFPNLGAGDFAVTSPQTPAYNCIAWAAEDNTHFWWPAHDGYWPAGVPRLESQEAFRLAFATLRYVVCADGSTRADYQKIAIYADATGKPTHASRQLPDGTWTSKLGQNHDIQHSTPRGVEGDKYGTVVFYMERAL